MNKKLTLNIVSCIIIILLGIYVFGFAIKKATNYEIYKQTQKETKLYTIWHIETFEGGGKARINYVKDVCRQIEKQHNDVLFMVFNVSPQELENKLKVETPDIVSFGFGVGRILLPHLKEIKDTYNVRDELLKSSTFGNALMCLPYISSGYALFSHSANFENYCYGLNEYVSPKPIIQNISKINSEESQYEAYKKFIYNKKTALVGTARDVFRVSNLNSIGRANALITPIDSYSDLIQYCGIVKKDNYTLKFIKTMLSNEQQHKLTDYSLFGVKNDKLYTSNIYNDMENAILKARVPNVFDE